MKTIPWITGGFFLLGVSAYLFFNWYMPLSQFSDYSNLVWGASAVGGVAGKFVSHRFETVAQGSQNAGDAS